MLFLGMYASQESPVESGKTYTFWAGGHIVYFMAVLLANLVLLRATHNWTGWGEAIILLQLASYFVCTYADSLIMNHGEIAYFYDEFMSSKTAWLGVLLVGCLIFIEKALVDMLNIVMRLGTFGKGGMPRQGQVMAEESTGALFENDAISVRQDNEGVKLYNKFDDDSSLIEMPSRTSTVAAVN